MEPLQCMINAPESRQSSSAASDNLVDHWPRLLSVHECQLSEVRGAVSTPSDGIRPPYVMGLIVASMQTFIAALPIARKYWHIYEVEQLY